MTLTIYFSLLVCIVGGCLFYFSAHPKRTELGRIACFCGLLAFLLQINGAHIVGFGVK